MNWPVFAPRPSGSPGTGGWTHECQHPFLPCDGGASDGGANRDSSIVVETGFVSHRGCSDRVSSGLRLPAARFSHHPLSPLPVPACRLANTAKGVLLRADRRLRGLRAASDVFLEDFWLAGDRALDSAGVLAGIVRGPGAAVPVEVRQTRGRIGTACLGWARVFPERSLLPAIFLAQRWLRLFLLAAGFLGDSSRHVRSRAGADAGGRAALVAVPNEGDR